MYSDTLPSAKTSLDKLVVTIYRNSRSEIGNPKHTKYSQATDTDESRLTEGEGPSLVPSEKFSAFISKFVAVNTHDSSNPSNAVLLHKNLKDADIQQLTYSITNPMPDFRKARHNTACKDYEHDYGVELIFDQIPIPSSLQPGRPLKLALFDMDSTLINEEVIDELARSIDKTDAVSAITARAMNGEIEFETSLRERVAMLKGVRSDVWDELRRTVTIAEGARELIEGLRKMGVVTGVVSGGFVPMAEWLKGELGLDYAFANHLLTSPPTSDHPYPHLKGTLSPDEPIVTPEFKRSTLLSLANKNEAPMSETLAVGDGSNDLLMLHAAGLGIAWNAKQRVQESAPMRLNGKSLADLLYLFNAGDL